MAIIEIEEKTSSNIPQEIIEIIVSKLSSIKSLLRFKTVCKSWNNMISDPVFVQNHLQRSPNNLFVCTDRTITGGRYSLVKLEGRKFHTAAQLTGDFLWWSKILCEYNGVLLLRDSRHYHKEYMLWNPYTGREMRFDSPYPRSSGLYLVNHGMCHDPRTDDFKVVLISGDRYTTYSCKKNSWTKKKKLGRQYHELYSLGINVDGAIYWILGYDVFHTELMYFDPRIDKLKTLQKPQQLPSDHDEHLSIGLTCLRGKLCLYCCDGKTEKTHIWIKEKGDTRNWKELITFEKSDTRSWRWTELLCSMENKMLIRLDWRKFVYYSPSEKTFEYFEETEANIYECKLIPYRSSLYFPTCVKTETRSIS